MTEIIAMLTKKQNLSLEPTETIGLTFYEMETFPSRTKRVKQRNLATSSVLHSFIVTGGSPPWKLTLHLINGTQINVSIKREFVKIALISYNKVHCDQLQVKLRSSPFSARLL